MEKEKIEHPPETAPDLTPDAAARLFEPPKIERPSGKIDESYALFLDDEEESDAVDEEFDEEESDAVDEG